MDRAEAAQSRQGALPGPSVLYDNSGWRVRARIINRSPFPIRQTNDNKTRPPYYIGGFQIGTGRQRRPFLATSVTPAFPDPLKPGATWSGTFGGSDLVVRGARYRVSFGYFLSPPESGYYGFYWVTTTRSVPSAA